MVCLQLNSLHGGFFVAELSARSLLIAELSTPGAYPGVGKGRGTNRLSCKWLGRARFSSSVLHFEVANNHLLVESHC